MSDDPNNTRWSQSSKSFGRNLLKKSGWTEGEGLGKSQEGVKQHVKVSKKDNVMGLGYQAGVGDTWSAQSVGFADVLDRIKNKATAVGSDSDDDDAQVVSPASASPTSPVGSKYTNMYAKRHALKTEGVHGRSEAKEEILGHAVRSKRSRSSTDSSALSVDAESSLQSSTLRRLMVRCPAAEPKPLSKEDGTKDRVEVTKPDPRPPKCTESPFIIVG